MIYDISFPSRLQASSAYSLAPGANTGMIPVTATGTYGNNLCYYCTVCTEYIQQQFKLLQTVKKKTTSAACKKEKKKKAEKRLLCALCFDVMCFVKIQYSNFYRALDSAGHSVEQFSLSNTHKQQIRST